MAEHSIAIRFGIENGAVVLRDLKAIGGNGEKALKRIADAGKPASRALQGVSAVAGDLRSRFENMASGLGPLGSGLLRLGPIGLGVAGAIGVVVAGLTKLVGKGAEVLEQLDTLDDTAQRIGISAEKFQALKFGFQLTGVKPEQLETSLMRLNDMIGDVLIRGADAPKETQLAFGKLGITFAEVKKHGDDLPWMINNIAEGVRKLPTVAEKTNVLRALFGKQGAQMLPLLDQGAAGIAKFTKMAIEMGAVVPDALVAAGSATNDEIGAINMAIDGQWARLTSGFGAWNRDFKAGLWQVLKWTADWKEKLDKQWAEDWEWQKQTAAAAWVGLKETWNSVTAGLGEAWTTVTAKMASAWDATTGAIGGAWDAVTAKIGAVWDAIAGRIGEAWDASVVRNKKAWDAMVAGLERVWPGAVTAIEGVWEELKTSWRTLVDGMGVAWKALTERLTAIWRRAMDALPIPGIVKRWLDKGFAAPGPGQSGATGDIPAPGTPAPAPTTKAPPGTTTAPPVGATPPAGKKAPSGATGSFPPMPRTPPAAKKTAATGRAPAVPRAAPSSAPAAPSARPAPERHASLNWSGELDVNVRGPADVRRVKSRGPIELGVYHGMSAVG